MIQVTPSIIAEAKTLLNFNGITDASQLTSTDIATIQAAIATVLGVSVTNVEILSIVNAALARRRGRRQLKGSARSFTLTTNGEQGLSVQSSGLNVDVNSQVIYNLVDYPNYNVTTLKKQIAEARNKFVAPQNEKGGTKSLYSNPQSTNTAELDKLHVDKVKEEVYL